MFLFFETTSQQSALVLGRLTQKGAFASVLLAVEWGRVHEDPYALPFPLGNEGGQARVMESGDPNL